LASPSLIQSYDILEFKIGFYEDFYVNGYLKKISTQNFLVKISRICPQTALKKWDKKNLGVTVNVSKKKI
jgi:hypothetical protein